VARACAGEVVAVEAEQPREPLGQDDEIAEHDAEQKERHADEDHEHDHAPAAGLKAGPTKAQNS